MELLLEILDFILLLIFPSPSADASAIFMNKFSTFAGIAVLIAAFVARYCFGALRLLYTGRKSGVKKGTWMPFVPFAATIYKLDILNEPLWKVVFIGNNIICAFAVGYPLLKISNSVPLVTVIVTVYFIVSFVMKARFALKFFAAFGIKPAVVLSFTPFNFFYAGIMYTLIGFTDLFKFRSAKRSAESRVVSKHPSSLGSIRGLSGMYEGKIFNMAGAEEIVIGKDRSVCRLVISKNAESIAPKHCGIIFDPPGQSYTVTDYSSGGVFLESGERVGFKRPARLPRGTALYLGDERNVFWLV